MFPSADKLYGDADFIFQQDLAPVHTAKGTKSWFNDHGVTVLDWPANSPDLNPIENLWGIVKRKMRDTRPNNADDLKATVKETWASILLQRRLPYRLLRTTRGNHHLNTSHSHSDSISHHPSYLGLTDHPHLHLIYTHTYKPHTHTNSLRSLDLPGCHFWALYPCLFSCYLTLDCLPVILIVCCLPRLGLFIGLWLFAACPDLLPGVRLCLCLVSTDLPAGIWPCTAWPFSIKIANGSKLLWLLVTHTTSAVPQTDHLHATPNWGSN